jgi:hypothetical protein
MLGWGDKAWAELSHEPAQSIALKPHKTHVPATIEETLAAFGMTKPAQSIAPQMNEAVQLIAQSGSGSTAE